MICSKDCSDLLPIILMNNVTIKSDNTPTYKSACSTIIVDYKPILMLTQYVTEKNLKEETNLIYYIYIVNNLKCDIYSIRLKDILPCGTKLHYTHVENGRYSCCGNKVFYNINHIKSHCFCKITVSVYPITLGKKINSIEVTCKEAKWTINNPCKTCGMINSDDILFKGIETS